MSGLIDALQSLVAIHAKYKLSGQFVKNSHVTGLWPSSLPSHPLLGELYSLFEPVDVKVETGVTPVRFAQVSSIERFQVGYRWYQSPTGLSAIEDWPAQFLVIMDDSGGGKPIIVAAATELLEVYAAYDSVTPFKIADSLADFINALVELIALVYGEFQVFEVQDDNGIREDFTHALARRVIPILGADNFDGFIDYFYG